VSSEEQQDGPGDPKRRAEWQGKADPERELEREQRDGGRYPPAFERSAAISRKAEECPDLTGAGQVQGADNTRDAESNAEHERTSRGARLSWKQYGPPSARSTVPEYGSLIAGGGPTS
jgi:hypothetical protein